MCSSYIMWAVFGIKLNAVLLAWWVLVGSYVLDEWVCAASTPHENAGKFCLWRDATYWRNGMEFIYQFFIIARNGNERRATEWKSKMWRKTGFQIHTTKKSITERASPIDRSSFAEWNDFFFFGFRLERLKKTRKKCQKHGCACSCWNRK